MFKKLFDEHNEDHNRSKNWLSRVFAVKVLLACLFYIELKVCGGAVLNIFILSYVFYCGASKA
jgi:hypothetical protein